MSSLNKACLIGNVGKDPELRRTNGGDPIASFSMAMSEAWRDKTSGERKERTEWINVVVFDPGLCQLVEKYVKKGSKLYVEGKIQTRKWIDQSGADRYTTEVALQRYQGTIVLLSDRGDGGDQRQSDPSRSRSREEDLRGAHARSRTPPKDDPPIDDDIPF